MTESGSATQDRAFLYSVVLIFALVNLVSAMDRSVLAILIEPIRLDLNLSDNEIGALGFAFAVFYALFGVMLGRLTDVGPRAKLLAGSVAIFSMATAACGIAGNFIQLYLARIVVGIGEAGAVPTKYSMIGDYFPPEQRASALSFMQAGLGVGPALGLIIGGLLAAEVGWRMSFVIFGLPGLLIAALVLFCVREPRRGRFESEATQIEAAPSVRETLAALWRNRTFAFIVIANTATTFAIYGIGYWMPSFLIRSLGMSVADVGLYYGSVVGLSMVAGLAVGAVLAPMMLKRDRRWEMLAPGIVNLVVAGTYGVVFMAQTLPVALPLIGITTFCLGLTVGPASAAIQSTVRSRMRGVAVAVTMLVSALIGQGLGPWIIGVASDAMSAGLGAESLRRALNLTPVVFIAGGLLYCFGARSFHRDRVD